MKKVNNDLDRIKKIAEKQFENQAYENQDDENAVGFDYFGQFIVNPWMDNSGRFRLTTEEAIELYGLENIMQFIKDIIKNYDLEV